MKQRILWILSLIQMPMVYLSYGLTLFAKPQYDWVFGVDEMANNLYYLSTIFDSSVSVTFTKNRYYQNQYDYSLRISNRFLRFFVRFFYGPLLLGYLAHKAKHFSYIWQTGFLCDREVEFKFLKWRGKKIVCIFIGDDIRSPKLTKERFDDKGIVSGIEYICHSTPSRLSASYEQEKKRTARIADIYADLIFNYECDQTSYLNAKVYPFPYIVNEDCFHYNESKFDKIDRVKIVHAPTNPIGKGTQVVRAAIKKLESQGYDFEYTELQDVDNQVVLQTLRDSHIALNEFYAFIPGLFGVEAMANHCAVLMSADPEIETSLPQGSQQAWCVTKFWEIYDNLKRLLDNTVLIKEYADRGYDFTKMHYSPEKAKDYYLNLFKESNIH